MIKNRIFIILILLFCIGLIIVFYEIQFLLSEDEQKACKVLCENENMIYKGGNNLGYGSRLGGCKVCYCERMVPLACSD